jgi:hypothetical protein
MRAFVIARGTWRSCDVEPRSKMLPTAWLTPQIQVRSILTAFVVDESERLVDSE